MFLALYYVSYCHSLCWYLHIQKSQIHIVRSIDPLGLGVTFKINWLTFLTGIFHHLKITFSTTKFVSYLPQRSSFYLILSLCISDILSQTHSFRHLWLLSLTFSPSTLHKVLSILYFLSTGTILDFLPHSPSLWPDHYHQLGVSSCHLLAHNNSVESLLR